MQRSSYKELLIYRAWATYGPFDHVMPNRGSVKRKDCKQSETFTTLKSVVNLSKLFQHHATIANKEFEITRYIRLCMWPCNCIILREL